MFTLLNHIADSDNLNQGLFHFFQQFETKKEALEYWRYNFEKSGCKETKKVLIEVLEWAF